MKKSVESGHWRPDRWQQKRVRAYMRHLVRHASAAADDLVGPYTSALVEAELRAHVASVESAMELHARGIKTIGAGDRPRWCEVVMFRAKNLAARLPQAASIAS